MVYGPTSRWLGRQGGREVGLRLGAEQLWGPSKALWLFRRGSWWGITPGCVRCEDKLRFVSNCQMRSLSTL